MVMIFFKEEVQVSQIHRINLLLSNKEKLQKIDSILILTYFLVMYRIR